MGFMDRLKAQLIEVIEWNDSTQNTIVHRFPVYSNEIKMGAKLTVRESQVAVFMDQGKIADVFTPGLHTLSTQNLPILTTLRSWKYGFNSPFKAEVYFISTKQFLDIKWGTPHPITARDADLGMVRLRSFGIFSFKVSDPKTVIKNVSGTDHDFMVEEIEEQLKKAIVARYADLLAESKIPFLDLAANQDELSSMLMGKVSPDFTLLGFELARFYIENISVPEEVEEMINKRSSVGVMKGVMGQFQQLQTAQAIGDAARNEGGMAGMGAGIGAGVGIGQVMAQSMASSMGQVQNDGGSGVSTISGNICPKCQTPNSQGAAFCSTCGNRLQPEEVLCVKCQKQIKKGAKFCSFCGAAQERVCPKCKEKVEQDTKFCDKCGEMLG
ncbi:MAG: SPFH domain-containing protein [bacterium]